MDPRVVKLLDEYAIARGDLMLRRLPKERSRDPRVLAGWALENAAGDPLKAIERVRGLRMDRTQRRETLDVLRELVTVYDLSKPLIHVAHR
jgi:hypothetical protein